MEPFHHVSIIQQCHSNTTRVLRAWPAIMVGILMLLQPTVVQSTSVQDKTWVVDGQVSAITVANGITYIGGLFSYFGPKTGGGAFLTQPTGDVASGSPFVDGIVRTAVPDGNGGFYLGGSFFSVGGVARNNVAHILADGTVDPNWNPNASGGVSSLAISGSTIYAGGSFTSIGGQPRNYIAALDGITGNATAWNPNASTVVQCLATSGSTIYAGGSFSTIGGQSRNCVAALDASTANATDWNPSATNPGSDFNEVRALAISGSTVYVGGTFSNIGGQARRNVAAIDAETGNALDWAPNASGQVQTLAIAGNLIYVGGAFTSIGGQSRNSIAALDAATGDATSWNPTLSAGDRVYVLTVSGSTIYVGGNFTSMSGQPRNRIAALDIASGSVTAWNPNANNEVYTIAVSGSNVYAGGYFTIIGGYSRNNLAAFDNSTGNPTAWNPNATGGFPNSSVFALAVSGSTVYAGGAFTRIGGLTRNRIAAIDASTGNATAWNPNANDNVFAVNVSGSTVYAGGFFSTIGGQTRPYFAALDATTGNATTWNPNASSTVRTIDVSGSTVYVGGDFTSIGGQPRSRIAALDASSGSATAWNPSASSSVYKLLVSGTTVYAAGAYVTIGGQTRNGLAALETSTGNATAWTPLLSPATVTDLTISGSTAYVAGTFASIGGQSRKGLASVDLATGNATDWNPNINSTPIAVAVSGSTIYAGGSSFFSVFRGAAAPGDLQVYGAGATISPGDSTPSATDLTDFGPVVVGTSVDQAPVRAFQIRNTGSGELSISNVQVSGAEFNLVSPSTFPVVLQPGAATSLLINANPTSLGSISTTVSVTSDDPDTPLYTFALQATGVGAQSTTPEKVDELTTSSGWQVLGSSVGLGYDAGNTALLMTLTTSTQTRVVGWREDAATDIPYASIGTDKVARGTFAIYSVAAPGINALPTTSTVFSLPNFRIRLMQRFVINSMLEVNHNSGNTDPAVRNLAREFSPSNDPAAPSVYTVDLDPVDIPYLLGSAGATEGVQRGVEAVGEVSPLLPDYQYVQGTLALTDSSVGTYPIPNRAQTPVKVYATGTTDFTNSDVTLTKLQLDHDPLASGIVSGLSLETSLTLTKSTAGITVDSTLVPASKVAIAAVDFLGGNGYDQTHPESRLRIDPERLYKISFRISSTGLTTSAPQIRLRARTAKFQWTHKLELGGAAAVGSAAGRAIIAEAMPGTNSQNLDSDGNGQWYHVWFTSPLQPNVRADVAGTMLDKFPLLMAQPGNGDPTNQSVRDLKLGFDVIDTLSFGVGYEGEVAKDINLNRIEIREYPQPDMTVAP